MRERLDIGGASIHRISLPNTVPLLNNLGYYALSLKQVDVAGQLFALNVLNYPMDANLLDSYGDYYQTVADKKNAIAWYQKALAIMEIADTRSKLNALLKEQQPATIK